MKGPGRRQASGEKTHTDRRTHTHKQTNELLSRALRHSNTTSFSRGRRVLRSGGPNHVNPRVQRVYPYLATKRPKHPLTKEPQRAAPVAAPVEVS
jgi:hypothetical protein